MNNEKANIMNQNGTKTGQEACPLDAIVNRLTRLRTEIRLQYKINSKMYVKTL